MIGLLLTLIVVILVAGAGYWAVTAIGSAFGLPAPVITVAQVIIVLAAVVFLLRHFGVGG